jgi:hypothetical protein
MTVIAFPGKPLIHIDGIWDTAQITMAVLNERAMIYQLNNNLLELVSVPPLTEHDRFDFKLRKINSLRLQVIMERAANYARFNTRYEIWEPCKAPIETARLIMKLRGYWNFPWIVQPIAEVVR